MKQIGCEDGPVCCEAETAQCKACKEGLSIKKFCKQNPTYAGCPKEEDDCDDTLMCAMAVTCVDGKEYPTACGPKNCDKPIGKCKTMDEPVEKKCPSDCKTWFDG